MNEIIMKLMAQTPPFRIAELVSSVNTDDRGLLLQQVAAFLRADGQGGAADVFERAAEIYNEAGKQ